MSLKCLLKEMEFGDMSSNTPPWFFLKIYDYFVTWSLKTYFSHTHTHTRLFFLIIKAMISVMFTDVFQVPGRHGKQLAWSRPALHTLLNGYISLPGKHQCFHVSYSFVDWKWKKSAGLNCISFCFICSLKVR